MTYEELEDVFGVKSIKATTADGVVWFIPLDDNNGMYQDYLRWKADNDKSA